MTTANKAKFTKGPWNIGTKQAKYKVSEKTPGYNKNTPAFTNEFSAISVGSEYQIAIIPLDCSNEFNAHLIKAAPDMYAEIENDIKRLTKEIKKISSWTPYPNLSIVNLERERDRKCDLLAKARGDL